MNRSDLIKAIAERQQYLLKRDVEQAVTCLIEHMITVLVNNKRIEVRGFGSFTLRHRRSRRGHNPKTGEILNLTVKSAIHFKPGKEIRDRVNAVREKCKIIK
jgi:integration host factor subunit beta